ncbi:MAG TPA: SRPBCC family protein [Longimicrobium sp.]|nr:SRPBCC family protein [Longimicrobium sp.]
MSQTTDDSIRFSVDVQATPERAFTSFTAEMAAWWPREYTWGVDALRDVIMEPREGGRWYERHAGGGEAEWGRVLAWDPPRRVVLSWAVGPTREPETDPARMSEVEARFTADGGSATRVELEHRGFARHGAGADEYRAGMGSPGGWPLILERFAAAV